MPELPCCSAALKEWSVTCEALRQGRQIILLRKGGILDEGGVFQLEQSAFWLLPTVLHQSPHLLQAEHQDLFAAAAGRDEPAALSLFATVERVYCLDEEQQRDLPQARHIWSRAYLDGRRDYQPQHPLLCVALRVYENEEPVVLPEDPSRGGCRSWVELPQAQPTLAARPVLSDGRQRELLEELDNVLRNNLNSTRK